MSEQIETFAFDDSYKPLVEKTLMKCIPRFTLEDRTTGLERSMAVYNRYGTTSVFEGHGIAGEVLAAYEAVRRKGPPRQVGRDAERRDI